MLGVISHSGRGEVDRLLAGVAERLLADGLAVAGVAQFNTERGAGLPCDMDLRVLTGGALVRISQNLGPLARGCRLDSAGLEQAVGLVEAALRADPPPRLLIINKFGKQEADGRGFRPAIGLALTNGISVLTAVNRTNRAAFDLFAEGVSEPVSADAEAILDWCRASAC